LYFHSPGILRGKDSMSEFARLENDITEGVANENGIVRLPEGVGSGAGLRADAQTQMAQAARVSLAG
jgi:hypothetical protein